MAADSAYEQCCPSAGKRSPESGSFALIEASEALGGVQASQIVVIGDVRCISKQGEISQHEADARKIDPSIANEVVSERDEGEHMRDGCQECQLHHDLKMVD